MRTPTSHYQMIRDPVGLTNISGGGNFPGRVATNIAGVPAGCPYPYALRFTPGNFDVKLAPSGIAGWKLITLEQHAYVFEGLWVGNAAIRFGIRWGTSYVNSYPTHHYQHFDVHMPPSTTEWKPFRFVFTFRLPVGASPYVTINFSSIGTADPQIQTHIAALTATVI